MEKIEHKNESVNGINMHVAEIGEGLAVLFVHGFPELCYTVFHIVGDLVALLDVLELEQVFLVGHDWGALICWYFCLFRPDRIKALVNMSVKFRPRNSLRKPMNILREFLGNDYYMCRFQPSDVASGLISPIDARRSRDDNDPNDIL
ncbi:hypothetical protein T459_19707 [Capsicum annuum]|uniref:AB hydrolase-1 domain-containing protein n=1 Tax=Capsicum annuum TaxID=4072 RepID=A0A2G2Z2U7_CAPAN|nr:hypothetical protein T459_19707 [Capsicum annuum]